MWRRETICTKFEQFKVIENIERMNTRNVREKLLPYINEIHKNNPLLKTANINRNVTLSAIT
jgi:hypothetical protein